MTDHDDTYNRPFFCESCQMQFAMGKQVELEDRTPLPICDLCWNQMPVGQRVKIAADLRHHRKITEAINSAGEWLEVARRLVEIVEGQGQEAGAGSANPWAEEKGGGEAWLN